MKKFREKLLIAAILLVICITIVIILLMLSINKTLHEDDAILQNNDTIIEDSRVEELNRSK